MTAKQIKAIVGVVVAILTAIAAFSNSEAIDEFVHNVTGTSEAE